LKITQFPLLLKQNGALLIIDGHHRSYINRKLGRKAIWSYSLSLPVQTTRRRLQLTLDLLEIKEVSKIEDEELQTWAHILKILKYYEHLYRVPFFMRSMSIPLSQLIPTQPAIEIDRLYPLREPEVPITCLESSSRYYILDGHVRSLSASFMDKRNISAIILWNRSIQNFGVERHAQTLGLTSLEDIEIVD